MKRGLVLAEIVFALLICGVIIGFSIHAFRSVDVSIVPYTYSLLKNLPEANTLVIEDCEKEGTCTMNANLLPNSIAEYCTRLSNTLTTAGNVNCKDSEFNGNRVNLRISNGTAIAFSDDEWNKLTDTDGGRQYVDARMEIRKPLSNTNISGGDTTFDIRIFRNGEVIPGSGYATQNDIFAYDVILDKDAGSGARNELPVPNLQKVSFKTAVCSVNPDFDTAYYKNTETQSQCSNTSAVNTCRNLAQGDYCKIVPVKPTGRGIFKLFGM